MIRRGGDRGERHRWGGAFLLLLSISARLYGALLVLYPKVFRRRYGAEMRRDFRELSREGLAEGGATELVRVWAQALSDVVLTALKERSTMLAARNAYSLSVDPRIAARAMVAVVFVAAAVTLASLWQTPTYEASTNLLVGQEQGNGQGANLVGSVEGLQALTQTTIIAINTRPVAEEAIRRLGLEMSPDELLDSLTIEQVENSQFIQVGYTDTDPERVQEVVNTVGEVSSERISGTSPGSRADNMTVTVFTRAITPANPASPKPLRNGLLTLVMGLVLCAGLALALPGAGASVAGRLGGRTVRQGVGQAGALAVAPADPSVAEGIEEKELLQALGRHGKLTAVGVALRTSLTVGEAERMLQALAARGHLEVSVERGRLVYVLWEGDAPP